jgi:hypothetical protein
MEVMVTSNGSSPNGVVSKSRDIWARPAAPQEDHVTQRMRQRVDGLPDWEPLPPGEIIVRRPRQS